MDTRGAGPSLDRSVPKKVRLPLARIFFKPEKKDSTRAFPQKGNLGMPKGRMEETEKLGNGLRFKGKLLVPQWGGLLLTLKLNEKSKG